MIMMVFSPPLQTMASEPVSIHPVKIVLAFFLFSFLAATAGYASYRYAIYDVMTDSGIYFFCMHGDYPGYYSCMQIEPLNVLFPDIQ